MSGYWCFHRSLLDWKNGLFMKGNYARIICFILSEAGYKKKTYNGTELQLGEFVTSYDYIAKRCCITKSSTRSALKTLEKQHFIRTRTSFQGTVITVLNYEHYQNSARPVHAKGTQNARKTTPSKKKEQINKKEYIEQQRPNTTYFPDNDLNEWVGYVSPTMLKKWERFDPVDLQQIAEEAKLYQEQSGKKYSSIALYLNNWFKRDKKYKQLEEEYNFNAMFEKYDKQF